MKNVLLFLGGLTVLGCGAVTVDVTAPGEAFAHYWANGTCAGRVNEGLRAGWQAQLLLAKAECHFKYIRMHDLFNDDMGVVFRQKNGKVVYNWQYVDDVYDFLVDADVKPFVELSFFPSAIAATNTIKQMWYRNCITPCETSYGDWHELVKAFTEHVVARYGLDEVKTWYFEVWNEPNLYRGFWEAGKHDYFRLYKESVTAVKSVSPELRVGGPATSNFIPDHRHDGEITDASKSRFYPQETINQQQWKGVWIEEFLAWCAAEKLPVDFISCHPYPTDYALDPEIGRSRGAVRYVDSMKDDLAWLKRTVAASAYPQAEIHLTEWSSSPNSRDPMHDELPPAAYVAKVAVENINQVDSLMYWTFTDIFEEKGPGQEIFHGGFGLLNYQGLPKPTYHAFRFLCRLGTEKLYGADPIFVTRDPATGKTRTLVYNYPDAYRAQAPHVGYAKSYLKNAAPKAVELTLTGLKPHARFAIETLDDDHGNGIKAWRAMGSPHSPTRAETAALRVAAEGTQKELLRASDEGTFTFARDVAPWSLVLIEEL